MKAHIGVLVVLFAACGKTEPSGLGAGAPASAPPPPPRPPSASATTTPSAPTNATDPPWKGMALPATSPRRFFALAASVCFATPAGGAACADAADPADGGTRLRLAFRPRAKVANVAEGAVRVPCVRTFDGAALCGGKEVARGVKSVAAAPYLLKDDGTVVVAHGFDPPLVASDGFRDAVAKKLPPLERLVATDGATCGLTKTGEVWCWPEPRYPIEMTPIPTRASLVPGVSGVADLTLTAWLTLCVRTKAGAVLCSPAPANRTELCVRRGDGAKNDLRCGKVASGPDGATAPAGAYDPSRALESPLVPVAGMSGADPAIDLTAYAKLPSYASDAPQRLYVGDVDEGGCARVASGAVRCWERSPCDDKTPWRSTEVEGLPPRAARLTLGAEDGYAVTGDGVLYTWARHSIRGKVALDCAKPRPFRLRAERVLLDEPVTDVGGGTFVVPSRPDYESHVDIDCITLASGAVHCWQTDGSAKVGISVLLAW